MADAGLFRIPFAEEYGGAGLQYPTLATMVMLEEVSYLSSGLSASMVDVQLILFGHTLKHASTEIKEKLFPAMMAGDLVGSFATSEPAASTDLSVKSLQTMAKPVEGGYELSGHKRWITNSPVADYMFVLTRLGEGMTMLLVDLKAALTSLTLGRLGIGACGVSMAQAAFDYAVDYMKERHVFGKPLASMQHWQYKFADYATQLENARNLYIKAALAEDKQRPSVQQQCSMAKLVGSSLAGDLARDAIQVCGGYGFVK